MHVRPYVRIRLQPGQSQGSQLRWGVRPESALRGAESAGVGRSRAKSLRSRAKSVRRQKEGEQSAGEVSRTRGRRLGAGLGTRFAGEERRWRHTTVIGGAGLFVFICLGLLGQDLKNVSRATIAAGEEKRCHATGHLSFPGDPRLPQTGQAATVSAVRGEDRARWTTHC